MQDHLEAGHRTIRLFEAFRACSSFYSHLGAKTRRVPTFLLAQHRSNYLRVVQEFFAQVTRAVHPHLGSNPTLKPQKSSFGPLMMTNVLSGGCI